MDLPNPSAEEPTAAHSGLGIASTLFAAAAAVLLTSSFGMLAKAAFTGAVPRSVTVKGAVTLVSLLGLGASGVLLAVGCGLGVAGLVQRGRRPLFAITGTVVNSSLLMTLMILTAFGTWAYKAGADKRAAASIPASPVPAAEPAAGAPLPTAHAAEAERLAAAAESAGYERVLVADLAADPARYESRKVAFSGFYSGVQLDSFAVFGKWASGGTVAVDGSKLSPAKQKALLLSLDGFHKVFVRGVFKKTAVRKSNVRILFMSQPDAPQRILADEVVDLGKVEDPTSER